MAHPKKEHLASQTTKNASQPDDISEGKVAKQDIRLGILLDFNKKGNQGRQEKMRTLRIKWKNNPSILEAMSLEETKTRLLKWYLGKFPLPPREDGLCEEEVAQLDKLLT